MEQDGLGPAFVPRPRKDLAQVRVADEVVLHDPASGLTHHLEPSAAVVWQCLDGRASVADIAADAVVALGTRTGTATEGLLRLVRRFRRAGLLEDSGRRPAPEPPSVRIAGGRRLLTVPPDE